MRQRFRSVIWRELPFSARRGIVGVVRTLDNLEDWCHRTWQSLHHSPAWLFVAVVGGVGILLTILLLLACSQELLASSRAPGMRRPIVDPADLPSASSFELDTRLCVEPRQPSRRDPAEFELAAIVAARPRHAAVESDDFSATEPPPRRSTKPKPAPPVEEPDPFADLPSSRAEPTGKPDVIAAVEFWRRGRRASATAGAETAEVLVARSGALDLGATQLASLHVSHTPGWAQGAGARRGAHDVEPRPYAALVPEAGSTAAEEDERFWSDAGAWPSHTDVGLRVELYAPERTPARQTARSQVVIRNTGAEAIRRVTLVEPTGALDVITAAEPSATATEGGLYRELLRLRPGRERTLSIDWFPRSTHDRRHEARVMAEALVAALVQVEAAPESEPPATPLAEPAPPRREPAPEVAPVDEPPPEPAPPARKATRRATVECRVGDAGSVAVGAAVAIPIHVKNTGETVLHDVCIWVDLPPGLRHRHGPLLEHQVGTLRPDQTHRAVLHVVAEQTGAAKAVVRVVSLEEATAQVESQISVLTPARGPRTAPPRRGPIAAPPADPPCCASPCWPQVSWLVPCE